MGAERNVPGAGAQLVLVGGEHERVFGQEWSHARPRLHLGGGHLVHRAHTARHMRTRAQHTRRANLHTAAGAPARTERGRQRLALVHARHAVRTNVTCQIITASIAISVSLSFSFVYTIFSFVVFVSFVS